MTRSDFYGPDLLPGYPNGFNQPGVESEPGLSVPATLLVIVVSAVACLSTNIFAAMFGDIHGHVMVLRPPTWRAARWRYELPHWTENLEGSSELYRMR